MRNALRSTMTCYRTGDSHDQSLCRFFFSLHILLNVAVQLEVEMWLRFMRMLSQLFAPVLEENVLPLSYVYEMTECERPTCVNNLQDLGRHSVNMNRNDFLTLFYGSRRQTCEDRLKSKQPLADCLSRCASSKGASRSKLNFLSF